MPSRELRAGAGGAGAEQLEGVAHVGEAVPLRQLLGPRFDRGTFDLHRRAATAADQVVVVDGTAPSVDGLAGVDSRNNARRAIGDGGASLNNVKVTDPDLVLGDDDFLHGSVAVIKRGRRNLAAARKA